MELPPNKSDVEVTIYIFDLGHSTVKFIRELSTWRLNALETNLNGVRPALRPRSRGHAKAWAENPIHAGFVMD